MNNIWLNLRVLHNLTIIYITLKLYKRQQRFHHVTLTRISRLLKYMLIGLGRKKWRSGFKKPPELTEGLKVGRVHPVRYNR